MTLVQIKQHMMDVKMASLGGLCDAFNAEPETMRCMMRHFEAKGLVRCAKRTAACGSQCFKCEERVTEIYEWL